MEHQLKIELFQLFVLHNIKLSQKNRLSTLRNTISIIFQEKSIFCKFAKSQTKKGKKSVSLQTETLV